MNLFIDKAAEQIGYRPELNEMREVGGPYLKNFWIRLVWTIAGN